MQYRVLSQPTAEPVTLDEVRQHLRLDTYGDPPAHPDDGLLPGLIAAAREHCEAFTGLALAAQTVLAVARPERLTRGGGALRLELPLSPALTVLSVTPANDEGLALPDLDPSEYTLDADVFPSVLVVRNPPRTARLAVRYTAGLSTPTAEEQPYPLPATLRAALLLVVGHLYENREETTPVALNTLPFGVEVLLRPHRLHFGAAV